MDQDCKDKPLHERLMKYSGRASFEAHCGKNPKQQHWRNSFKVDVEGTVDHLHTKAITLHMAVICAVPGCIEKEVLKLLP